MKIILEDLRTDWGKNDVAELFVQDFISKHFKIVKGVVSEGYAPEFDFFLGNKSIELKFYSASTMYIEYAREDNRPTGISLSKADYYLTVNPGGSKGRQVGKLRLVKRDEMVSESIRNKSVHIEYPGGKYNPIGTKGYKVNPRDLYDICIAEVGLIKEGNRVVGYDFDDFTIPQYAKNNMTRWIK